MKLLLVDDHVLIGKSLEISLKKYPEITDFKYVSDPSFIEKIIETYQPSIILLDIHMGCYNGLEIGRKIIKKFSIKTVFLSGFNLVEYREQAYSIGAHGFLDKHIPIDKLVDNLSKIYYQNSKVFSEIKTENSNYYSLTLREKEILQFLSQGIKQTAIATDLNISERTLRNHIYSINEKLETNSALSSVIKAIELGIVSIQLQ